MAKFNPDFWEVTLAADRWQRFAQTDRIWHEAPEDVTERHERLDRARRLWPDVRRLIDDILTDRQREVVLLHFIEELNQRQIAERLGISQQSVSEHLYGKMRNGRAVGGALRKLRKACARQGLLLDG
jgi:RNA polymerase sigma factor (sigma-70 family)